MKVENYPQVHTIRVVSKKNIKILKKIRRLLCYFDFHDENITTDYMYPYHYWNKCIYCGRVLNGFEHKRWVEETLKKERALLLKGMYWG